MPKNKKEVEKIKVKIVPNNKPNIGIDTDDTFQETVLTAAQDSTLDFSKLESFTNVAQTRDQIYSTIDTMMNDSTLNAILECYTADVVDTNDVGDAVWCEAPDSAVANHITYLLESLNINKNINRWTKKLIKYGDLYLKLYRESDLKDDPLFNNKRKEKEKLVEAVDVSVHNQNDHYVHYVEAVSNPSEFFELTKYGKTMGYIKAPINVQTPFGNAQDSTSFNLLRYHLRKRDITLYAPTDYVHAYLGDNSSRIQEEVNIFMNDYNYDNKLEPLVYQVRRGESLFNNVFKVWREMTLLENSLLLARITKSAIVRILSIEVGDMPKEQATNLLSRIKSQVEQKSALDTNVSMAEYANPGPIENVIYVPTHNGQGNITSSQIGGDVDPKQLTDLDWFNNRLFGALGVPKQYFGFTDDGAGFNGGKSLSIISSRYGKKVKYIQKALCQAITDIINLLLLDSGYESYVNQFSIKMQPPITQEELDRREASDNKIRYVGDIMNQLNEVEDKQARLKILKSLLSNVITDPEIIQVLQDEIDKLEVKEEVPTDIPTEETGDGLDISDLDSGTPEVSDMPLDLDIDYNADTDSIDMIDNEIAPEEPARGEATDTLPSPADLDIDMTQNF